MRRSPVRFLVAGVLPALGAVLAWPAIPQAEACGGWPPLPDQAHQGTPSWPLQGPSMIQQHGNPLVEEPGLPTQKNPRWPESDAFPEPYYVATPFGKHGGQPLPRPSSVRFRRLSSLPRGAEVGLAGLERGRIVDLYLRLAPGVEIPPHWMTANREVRVISGQASILGEATRELPLVADGYRQVLPGQVLTVRCWGKTTCLVFVRQRGDFNPHYDLSVRQQ